jgi:hypothetical protein
MNMEFFDADGTYIGPGANASDEARERAGRLYRQGLRRQQQAGERVEYGRNDHHREFTNICTGQILYGAGLVPLENLSRSVRDEIGGKVNLISMMRDYISLNGGTPPSIDDKNALVRSALSSSDFLNLISTVLNKSLIAGYDSAPECWPAFTKYAPVNDFKSADFILNTSVNAPPEVVEGGELKQAAFTDDGAESDYIRSHVHRVTISRQALLNSDTTALANLPFQNGVAVSRAIGDAVFSLLTTNSSLADGISLFHADHGNLDSAAAPSVASLDTAFTLMGAQQNGAGEYLNYKPRFVIGGPSKASTLSVLRSAVNTGNDGESDGVITTLIDSRLSGTTKWFTVADPIHGGILIAVLAGTEGQPRFEQITNAPSTAADGLHFKCGYDFRVVCGNFKALTYNAGS